MNEKINEMCVKMYKELSYNGYSPQVLKSAIQKYLRRNERQKGFWCLIELDLFSFIENNQLIAEHHAKKDNLSLKIIQMNAKKLRTNTINRLIVMMSEEVSVSCWWLPIEIKRLHECWLKSRNNSIESRLYLLEIYNLLHQSDKIRLVSDYKSVFNLPFNAGSSLTHLNLLRKSNLTQITSLFETKEKLTESEILEKFEINLEEKKDNAFYWLSLLIKDENKKYLDKIWAITYNKSPKRDVCEALKYFHDKMSHREKWLYLYHAILLIILESKINWNTTTNSFSRLTKDEVKQLYDINLNGTKIELDSYVFDIHTTKKRIEFGRTKFALEGAYIENEDKKFLNENYRRFYIDLKRHIDENEQKSNKRKSYDDESNPAKILKFEMISDFIQKLGYNLKKLSTKDEELIISLPRGQKRTSSYKKSVFIGKESTFKGPYEENDIKLKLNLMNTKTIQYLEKLLDVKSTSILDWDEILQTSDNKYYLKSKNIGKNLKEYDSEMVSSRIESNVTVVKRGSMVKRINEIENDDELSDELRISIVQHLYFRFLLDIGDSGTHNILLRDDDKTKIVGIDLEEKVSSRKEAKNKLNLLMKRVSKSQDKLYRSFIDKIKIFRKELDEKDVDNLKKFEVDVEKLNENIKRWLLR